jgi:hypothetical protein
MRNFVNLRADDKTVAERLLLKSLKIGRLQGTSAWALRIAITLSNQWRLDGRCNDALDLLLPVYDRFTEGHGTADLNRAKETRLADLSYILNAATKPLETPLGAATIYAGL